MNKSRICLNCGKSMLGMPCISRRKYCGNDCVKSAERAKGPERFWAKVQKTDTCWLYTGFKKWDGYGWVARSQGNNKFRWMTSHRYAWILTHGEPPEGISIMHICDVPACCNPAHLRLGTHAENMADMAAKGRAWKGGNRRKGGSVLHPERVRPVRHA